MRMRPPEPSPTSGLTVISHSNNEEGQILEEMALEESFVFQNSEVECSLRAKAAEAAEAALRSGTFETAEAALRSEPAEVALR